MSLSGKSLIGFRDGTASDSSFRGTAPATGEELDPVFYSASPVEVELAAQLSLEAFAVYGRFPGRHKAAFLKRIAANLEGIADSLIPRAHAETALPLPRLQGELARTCAQLRLFAGVIDEGSWVMPRIDRAVPDRQPARKPDIRSMLRPLGPVVVFGASNFPLAFSVAGGDTASALAAGCPVIVKAHPAHPGTSELAGLAIRNSVSESGLPEGVFSLLFDSGVSVGRQLVQHSAIKAGAFTGSYAAGRALFDLAARRPDPIPFLAEMSSANPVFVLPGALVKAAGKIAEGLYNSFTLGAGQFCTKPGLVFLYEGEFVEAFLRVLREKVAGAPSYMLLTAGIASAFHSEENLRGRNGRLRVLARGNTQAPPAPASAAATLYETDLSTILTEPSVSSEHFGPSTVIARYRSKSDILECAKNLSGHLTATIHGTPEDLVEFAELIGILENKVGRIIFDGFPTGVEVTDAMVHGGPFPAASDARATSVGSLAILRFVRPLCYQDFPDAALPAELQNANPLGVYRLVDGKPGKNPLS
jgi:NADP-dependent aldehyde dehydrogenase